MPTMKYLVILLLFLASMLCSDVAVADPGQRRTKEDRRAARVERQLSRKAANFSERSPEQRRKERHVMIVTIIGAALIYNVLNGQEK